MANEKRLIDANELTAILAGEKSLWLNNTEYYPNWLISACIASCPTVDAVEVVRCDECIHYKQPDEGDFLGLCTSGILSVSHNGEIYPGRGFFCLYGERKAK